MILPVIQPLYLEDLTIPIQVRIKEEERKLYWETREFYHSHLKSIELDIQFDADTRTQYILKQSLFNFFLCNPDADLTRLRIDDRLKDKISIMYFLNQNEILSIPVFAKLGQRVFLSIFEKQPVLKFILKQYLIN